MNYQGPDNNMIQGKNSAGETGYRGPSPPSGTHHYYITLYALDTILKLNADAGKQDVSDAMNGHILGQTQYMGIFKA